MRNERGSVKLYLIDIRADLIDKSSLEALGGSDNCTIIKADLSKEEEVEAAWNQIISTCKRVDILINNAARVQGKKLKDMDMHEFRKSISINLLAYVHLAKLFLDQ